VVLKTSTLIGNAKPIYDLKVIADEKLKILIEEAAKGSEYSRKEEKKVRECEHKVKKYKKKIAYMKSIPAKWDKLTHDVKGLVS